MTEISLTETTHRRFGGLIERPMRWPNEHIAWQGIIEADPDMAVPFGVHVFIFNTIEQLQSACGDPKACGHSTVWNQPDGANVGALIMLVKSHLALSLIAH